ncbi:MAG: ribbon-helix-helix protein, CopG family, partial [Candidatus Korarchaeum sp.]
MSRTVGARIPLDLYERIMRVSEERGISASDLIKEAATLYLRLLEMAEERGTTVEKLVNAIEK